MIRTYKEYREEQYMEMAMQSMSNMALFNDARLIGIYNANAMKSALEKNNWQEMMKSILGAISFRKNETYKANETTGIAAEHGYGPLLCLLLMHRSPNGLIPNRVAQEMNADAKRVWQQFVEGAGKDLVIAEPIATGLMLGPLEPRHHKESYLNMRFSLRRPIPGLVESERRNKQVLGLDQYGNKRAKIAQIFERYLSESLGRVYPEVTEIIKEIHDY